MYFLRFKWSKAFILRKTTCHTDSFSNLHIITHSLTPMYSSHDFSVAMPLPCLHDSSTDQRCKWRQRRYRNAKQLRQHVFPKWTGLHQSCNFQHGFIIFPLYYYCCYYSELLMHTFWTLQKLQY